MTGRALVRWTDRAWATAEEAVEKALARTAKCRLVVPKAPDQLGDKAVVVPRIEGAGGRFGTVTTAYLCASSLTTTA
jgi:hypothetical protein